MKRYIKPEIEVKGYQSSESFADIREDIFGAGNEIPITVYKGG